MIKTLFIHIPKTGGSSMAQLPFGKQYTHQHKPISWHIETEKFTPFEKLDDYFKFTIVRNPYTRFASGVLNHKYATPENFNEWIATTFLEYPKHWKDWEWIHIIPQHQFTHYNGENQMDLILHFENLEHDFITLQEKLAEKEETATEAMLIKALKLDHVNRQEYSGTDYMKFYNEKSKRIIADVFEIDFNEFGYENALKGKK